MFGAGLVALVEADQRCDDVLGSFVPYAIRRVRGGALDERRRFASQIGRYRGRPREENPIMMPIDGWRDEGQIAVDAEIQPPRDPAQQAEANEHALRLAKALELLGEQERIVLSLYYFEDLKQGEIARVLNLTESRICKVHAQACERLREMLMPGERPGGAATEQRYVSAAAVREARKLRNAARGRIRAAAVASARRAAHSPARRAAVARHDAAIAARIARITEGAG